MADDDRRDTAGILARGFDEHMEVHGPDGSYAVRDGARYEVTERDGSSVARVFYRGRYYSVTVTETEDRCGLCFSDLPHAQIPGESCPAHGHDLIPGNHPDGMTADYQDWHGCPLPGCREGRWLG